jgi:phospholipid-binding lipoprotein MlaA
MLALAAAGCATSRPADGAAAQGAGVGTSAATVGKVSKTDPWENFNRRMFAFNEAVDAAVLKPVAEAYKAVVPQLVRQGFDNVLSNVGDAWSAVNHLLQGKAQRGLETMMRVGANTVFGLGGLLDPASELGLERQNEDFGQTLGRWGVPTGPYLVLPFLGPRTVRDAAAYPVDRVTGLAYLAGDGASAYAMTALELVHYRAGLLGAGSLLNQIALDKYVFVRESYLAKRRNDVYDGNPPPSEDDDPYEAPEPAKTR